MIRTPYSLAALGAIALPVALAPGSLTFLGFLVIAFVSIVIGWYTRKGSGIDEHPYGKIYSGAPGARARAGVFGPDARKDDFWIRRRGTR